jgi:hypothetical protein
MECPIMDERINCKTRLDADTEPTSIMGYYHRFRDCTATSARLSGSIYLAHLYCATNIPGYAEAGYGWWRHGYEF